MDAYLFEMIAHRRNIHQFMSEVLIDPANHPYWKLHAPHLLTILCIPFHVVFHSLKQSFAVVYKVFFIRLSSHYYSFTHSFSFVYAVVFHVYFRHSSFSFWCNPVALLSISDELNMPTRIDLRGCYKCKFHLTIVIYVLDVLFFGSLKLTGVFGYVRLVFFLHSLHAFLI